MNSWTSPYFSEALDLKRLEILPKLKFFTDSWCYLAWRMAASLFYWHRRSIDFDFFTADPIDTEKLHLEISE